MHLPANSCARSCNLATKCIGSESNNEIDGGAKNYLCDTHSRRSWIARSVGANRLDEFISFYDPCGSCTILSELDSMVLLGFPSPNNPVGNLPPIFLHAPISLFPSLSVSFLLRPPSFHQLTCWWVIYAIHHSSYKLHFQPPIHRIPAQAPLCRFSLPRAERWRCELLFMSPDGRHFRSASLVRSTGMNREFDRIVESWGEWGASEG